MYCDNHAVMYVANNHVFHERNRLSLYREESWKYIAKFSWINEKLQQLKFQLQDREDTQAQIFSLFKAGLFA